MCVKISCLLPWKQRGEKMKRSLIAKVEPELTCREELQHAAIPSLPPVCRNMNPGVGGYQTLIASQFICIVKAQFYLSLFCLSRMSHKKSIHRSFLSHSANLCGGTVRVQFGEQHSQHAFIVKAHYVHSHRQTQRHLCCCSPWWAGPEIARHNTGRWLLAASSQVCTQPLMSC